MARERVIVIRHPEPTDEVWAELSRHLPGPLAPPDGGPKPVPNRPVVEGIPWVLRDGGRWGAPPEGYPPPATCWRRLPVREDDGAWLLARRTSLDELDAEGRLRWDECLADGSFAPAKKGDGVGKTKKGEGTTRMVVVEGQGIPPASPPRLGQPGGGDAAGADAGGHRGDRGRGGRLATASPTADPGPGPRQRPVAGAAGRVIEVTGPHRRDREGSRAQDDRPLRRHKRRSEVERTFARPGNHRRPVVRYERTLRMYRASPHVACLLITLRKL